MVRGIGEGGDGKCTRMTIEHKIERVMNHHAGGTVSLPPYVTASISFHADRFLAPDKVRRLDEHFGDRTLQFIKDKPVTTTIDLSELGEANTSLRIGLLGPEEGDVLAAKLNGESLTLAPVPLQEIPLDPGKLNTSNQLEVSLAKPTGNAKLALGFAAIVVRSGG